MIFNFKNIAALSLLALFFIGCNSPVYNQNIPTLVPTIAITYVLPDSGQPAAAQLPATETPFMPTTATVEDGIPSTPEAPLLTTGEAGQAPAGDYPGPGSASLAEPANQGVAQAPTQTPVGVLIAGAAEPPVSGSIPEPTATSGPAAPTGEPPSVPTQSTGGGGGGVDEWARFFLVAVGDNGASGQPAGCGDSLVEMSLPLESATNEPLRISVERLLGLEEQYMGDLELYNPLWQSDITLTSASVDAGGTATLALSGQPNLVEACDPQRVKAMLEATARRSPGVQSVSITLNGQPIDQALPTQ